VQPHHRCAPDTGGSNARGAYRRGPTSPNVGTATPLAPPSPCRAMTSEVWLRPRRSVSARQPNKAANPETTEPLAFPVPALFVPFPIRFSPPPQRVTTTSPETNESLALPLPDRLVPRPLPSPATKNPPTGSHGERVHLRHVRHRGRRRARRPPSDSDPPRARPAREAPSGIVPTAYHGPPQPSKAPSPNDLRGLARIPMRTTSHVSLRTRTARW
jgi:hypothetical protein